MKKQSRKSRSAKSQTSHQGGRGRSSTSRMPREEREEYPEQSGTDSATPPRGRSENMRDESDEESTRSADRER